MTKSEVMPFAKIVPGMVIETSSVEVTGAMIDAFAALSGDDYEIHLDDAAAKARGYEGRIVHGLLGLALTDGLKAHAEHKFDAIASLEWNWKFTAPIYVGDRLQASIEVLDKRVTSDPARGVVRMALILRNQDDATVQKGTNALMVRVA